MYAAARSTTTASKTPHALCAVEHAQLLVHSRQQDHGCCCGALLAAGTTLPLAPTIKGLQLLVPFEAAPQIRGPGLTDIEPCDAGGYPAHVTQHCAVTRVTLDGEGCLKETKEGSKTSKVVRLAAKV
jgi:hypothetical protein